MWARFTRNDTVSVGPDGQASTNLLSEFESSFGAGLIGCTIMRVRGEIFIQHSTVQTVRTTGLYGYGIYVGQASTTTGSQHPDPILAPGQHADWMAFGIHHTMVGSTAEQGTGVFDGGALARIPVDVRSRRRLDELDSALFLIENSTNTAYDVMAALSILVALP